MLKRSSLQNALSIGLLAAGLSAGCASKSAPLVESLPRPELDVQARLIPADGAPAHFPSPTPMPVFVPPVPAPTAASAPPAQSAGGPSALSLPRGRPWKWIVIHHSATADGNAANFDRAHRGNGWDELGYHFVIDNGRGGSDGAVEVGPRWTKQKWGAHAKTADNRFNDYGIGICLVGNFNETRPSAAQLKSSAALVANLMKAYDIPADRVIGHRDAKATACPGRHCDVEAIRRLAVAAMNAAGGPPRAVVAAAGSELLQDR